MEPEQIAQLEYIVLQMTVGAAVLDATTLHIRYANPFLTTHLPEPWRSQDLRGHALDEMLPPTTYATIEPILRQVAATGQMQEYAALPYEGFLETRGRTYWHVRIERMAEPHTASVLVTIDDVTNTIRSQLHLNAIHYISSAIGGPASLPLVLGRILHVLQEMVGSKRCAILLIDQTLPGEERQAFERSLYTQTVTIAAQRDIHPCSQDWHPAVDEYILLGHVIRERHAIVITDTSTTPEIAFPFLNKRGVPQRPGSALCVPIFERRPASSATTLGTVHTPTEKVLGSIEVYHRRARGFPAEEVQLLERFAQQVGLAIQTAQLFRQTDRLAQDASRHARQKENIMQAIPDGVVIYDPRWRIADINQAARQLLGWSDEVLGLSIVEAFKRSSASFQVDFTTWPDLIHDLEQRAQQGQIDELKMRSADGHDRTLRCTYTPIRDELGDTFAFITIYHDVTDEVAARERIEAEVVARTAELKQRNQALQQARIEQERTNERINLLLARLPYGVLLVSAADGCITVINRQAVQLFQRLGLPIEPLDDPDEAGRRATGLHCEQLFDELQARRPSGSLSPIQEHPLHKALVQGEASEIEWQTISPGGQLMHLLINITPLFAPDGSVNSAILVLQEITRIKTLERAREDFFTTMAHELKTPLANIRAHLSALLARDLAWSSEEQYDFLQTADAQVERLVGMINHFLDASRVEAGALRLELEPIIIPELFEDLQDRLEALITTSHRQLQVELSPALPAVRGDYELIMNVLTNLLSNAFRYAPENDAVMLRASATPSGVCFSVIDRGPGIGSEQQAALFTRFSTFAAMSRPSVNRPGQPALERQQKTTRWSPATGLGLYISQGIVEAHGSKLMLTSSPGQGATFAFTLAAFKEAHEREPVEQ